MAAESIDRMSLPLGVEGSTRVDMAGKGQVIDGTCVSPRSPA
jgi:hypothetical protein